jgi:hypothetical protein
MDGQPFVKQVIAGVAATIIVALLWVAWRKSGALAPKRPAWAGAQIDWGKPARHGCDIGWMSDALPHPHPIYRQWIPGAHRDGLSEYGWSWISDPPGEEAGYAGE